MNPFDEDEDDGPINPFDVDTTPKNKRTNGMTRTTSMIITEDIHSHWRELHGIITTGITDPFDVVDVKKHFIAIGKLVAEETPQSTGRTGDCLEHLLSEDVIEQIYTLSLRERNYSKDLRVCILNFFVELLSSPQPLLIHQQVLRPLTKLLHSLEESKDEDITAAMVPVLHQICVIVHDNPSLLDLFFMDGRKSSQSKCLVFALLISHIHETTNRVLTGDVYGNSKSVANCSRDAVLLFLSLAKKMDHKGVAAFITDDTSFCPVLATSLSATYSELPTVQVLNCDEWSSVTECVRWSVLSLSAFVQCLQFCNSVIQVSPDEVVQKILSLIHDGFLQQVLGPALFQKSESALVFSTAYLNISLTTITAPQLMREFLQFLVAGSHDNEPILDALVGRIECISELCAVSLELFYTLVDLNCEDVMLELVLKYLLPGIHVKSSQLKQVGAPDVYSQLASDLLDIRPRVCKAAENLYIQRCVYDTNFPVVNSNGFSDPETISSHFKWFKKKTPTPFYSEGSNSIHIAYISVESSYYLQLHSARKAIEECARACRCWSSSYDSCVTTSHTSNHTRSLSPTYSSTRYSGKASSHGDTSNKSRHNSIYLNTKAGVFVKVLFEKLSRMLRLTPQVNLPLTKLIARLCHYPHPLVRSFLLNHKLTLLPAVPDLHLILSQISAEIGQLAKEEGIDMRLARARKTMVFKADTILHPHHHPPLPVNTSTPSVDREQDLHDRTGDISMTDFPEDPLPGGSSTGTEGNTPRRTHNETSFTETTVPQPSTPPGGSTSEISGGSTRQKKKHKKIATSKLFAIVIFDEFLKELAAISQEQSIVSPISYMPLDDR